ncbi:lipoyl(octanoyl) transferase LipB [Acidaminobacter hydrogenoformans]|uniref:Octanoyltransferase n=1 Tax=Acidaminobacter hydrogenoformans DSM 2784 TaxID=1120920 RepID=A0A1G5RV13_9FIRM|nr:lipoyl(octanoyl) transferase LipB [Acidaminobacter hydrogenoformans]SCZ77893.1 lipoyl(octanoyl) transferase [Acidaminobacter hydrogenoformans DSM 2784]
MKALQVLNLGRCDYMTAYQIQLDLVAKRQKGEIEDTLILVEHPPVITLGKSAEDGHILFAEAFLKEQGIEVHQIERGGDVTYHGPGQIVGYPIFDIKRGGIGIRPFVENLEQLFIRLLKEEFDIPAGKDPVHTGVWVGDSKITAIGLAVKRGVTMHGFAFNVNTEMSHFQFIVPCGIADRGVTSLEKLTGETQDFGHITELVTTYFCKVFGFDAVTSCHYEAGVLVPEEGVR